ncbi:unnamed protein product, partial [Rhizophagus irregularis]
AVGVIIRIYLGSRLSIVGLDTGLVAESVVELGL